MSGKIEHLYLLNGQLQGLLTARQYTRKKTYAYEMIENHISKIENLIKEAQ